MLRIATVEDTELVLEMATKFLEKTSYKDLFDKELLKHIITDFVSSIGDDKVVIIHDKGMIAGMVTPFYFGKVKQATELAWWVDPSARKEGVGEKLLEAFEFWANKIGCKHVVMAALDEKLEKFYTSKGYRLVEHIYTKEL